MTYKRAALVWLLQSTQRREFRYIYKPGNPSRTRGHTYLFVFFLMERRNFNEIERSILLIMIYLEILLFILIHYNFGNVHRPNLRYKSFKDAMSVSFRSELFTSYILTYLSSETCSCKYEKLPNIVIHACKNITEKMYLLKMSGPQIWLCLFTFRPIASKQLIGLTTIDTLS